MQAAAGDNADKPPGLIQVQFDHWIDHLAHVQTTRPKTIVDGTRIRDIKVAVGAMASTKILAPSKAAERGGPYRDLMHQP